MFTFGFYNSKNGDRKYNATHLGKMFDGIIQDGVLGAVGDAFRVDANTAQGASRLTAVVNPGKAWLMNTWNTLDAKMVVSFNSVTAGRKRTDTIVIEVNNNYDETGFTSRTNQIKVIEGTPVATSTPGITPPALTQIWNTNQTERRIWQYPIANVTIYGSDTPSGAIVYKANVIDSANITTTINPTWGKDGSGNKVDEYITWTPLVTGAPMDATDYIPSLQDFEHACDSIVKSEEAAFNTWFDALHEVIVTDSSSQAALTNLNNKIDNKILFGTSDPSTLQDDDLTPGQIYFQIED